MISFTIRCYSSNFGTVHYWGTVQSRSIYEAFERDVTHDALRGILAISGGRGVVPRGAGVLLGSARIETVGSVAGCEVDRDGSRVPLLLGGRAQALRELRLLT